MDDFYEVKVRKVEQLTADIKRYTFISERTELPSFGAGSHITLHLPMGNRQYSLINNPLDMENEYVIAVKKIGQQEGGSSYLHEKINEGDVVKVSPPHNYFPLRLEAKHHVFFAAGIGITPFLSMMAYLKSLGESFELHYAPSSEDDCPFYNEMNEMYPNQIIYYFMARDSKKKKLKETLKNLKVGAHIYTCGPQSFMDFIVDYCRELGYPKKYIHEERFKPAKVIENPQPFEVTIENKKKKVLVQEDQSLLDALHKAEIPLAFACRRGICGTCEVKVCNGEVLHNDAFLTDDEKRDKMLACVSRGIDHISIAVD
ncbi:PDR/VanB family oxidoreductase [Pseudalkalibacillus hwajinpoensis]|uniref:Oxidoreductase n=1 Tax=Guptibacillus hwajinpoensis TaxID=208199 RepID=A0A4U1MGY6_9BACL|nr:PDR/VanB family oxidoreductase [Pseudalkalibacillus hwajinpoensis]TKD69987.1 oxidoreductase [Pseudalkalibacillus hwajinpoensis]